MKQIHRSVECLSLQRLNRMKKAAWGALAAACLLFASTSAFASCGMIADKNAAEVGLPAPAQAGPGITALIGSADDVRADASIVGLWHTDYTVGGAPFAESFKLWHSDGTELDLINQNPALGTVCIGVWKQVGARDVRLHHVGWVYAPDGTALGSFTLDETDTIAENGMSYSGEFTFRIYDVNGNFTGTAYTGAVAATRITVN